MIGEIEWDDNKLCKTEFFYFRILGASLMWWLEMADLYWSISTRLPLWLKYKTCASGEIKKGFYILN